MFTEKNYKKKQNMKNVTQGHKSNHFAAWSNRAILRGYNDFTAC